MKNITARFIAFGILFISGHIQAQSSPNVEFYIDNSVINVTGTPVSLDDARSRGNNLITKDHVVGEFENITNDSRVKIRHKKTGLICNAPVLFSVVPPSELVNLSSARKFICTNTANGFQNDLWFTENKYTLSAKRALAAVVSELRAKIRRLTYVTANISWNEDSIPDSCYESTNKISEAPSEALLSTGNGPDSRYVYVSVVILHGWIITNLTQGVYSQKDRIDLVGREMMRRSIRDIQGKI